MDNLNSYGVTSYTLSDLGTISTVRNSPSWVWIS